VIAGDLQAALDDCNESLRLEPNAAATFDSRGLAYLKLGKWELAITDYNSALRLSPKLPNALYGRGFAKLKAGDLSGGKTDIVAAKTVEQNIVGEFARYGLH
jgi:tetratricopeptide (TPR) repeat protein